MQYTRLGRTGLPVSVAGLGCGGFSRLGLSRGASRAQASALVGRALDAGVNFIDTAAAYGTEDVVGAALRSRRRDRVVISTKAGIFRSGEPVDAAQVVASLDASLRALGTDYVDVFHLHGVAPQQLAHAREHIVPALQRERAAGKLRHIGITEVPPRDPAHTMLASALDDERFDVVMVAFHMLHQNAASTVLPRARSLGVGTLGMFAVRVIFSAPQRLQQAMDALIAEGELASPSNANEPPLSFLVRDGGADSVIDAAYRFCRHQPGIDVVLFGTGVPAHMDAAIESILRPPLPASDLARLRRDFGHLQGVGLDAPPPRPGR